MKNTVFFAFRADPVCFVHVLLNALDVTAHDGMARIVFEGQAVTLIGALRSDEHPLHALYEKTKKKGLIDGVCKACAVKLGAQDAAEEEGLALLADMSGHAGMARYLEMGWDVITL